MPGTIQKMRDRKLANAMDALQVILPELKTQPNGRRPGDSDAMLDLVVLGRPETGNRIKSLRSLSGLNRLELADLCGLRPQDISRLEKKPQLGTLGEFVAVSVVLRDYLRAEILVPKRPNRSKRGVPTRAGAVVVNGAGRAGHNAEALGVAKKIRACASAIGARLGQPEGYMCYAWGTARHEARVIKLAQDSRTLGISVVFDRWVNIPGTSVSEYVDRIEEAEWLIVVGTPGLRSKYRAKDVGTVVGAELRLINARLRNSRASRERVIPVLLEGTPETAFPPQLRDLVYIDARKPELYSAALGLLGATCHGLPLSSPIVSGMIESLRSKYQQS